MDTTSISTKLMKLLEGIGTNEPVDTILPTIDGLIHDIEGVCRRAEELDFYQHHLQLSERQNKIYSEEDTRLQAIVDNVHERYKTIMQV